MVLRRSRVCIGFCVCPFPDFPLSGAHLWVQVCTLLKEGSTLGWRNRQAWGPWEEQRALLTTEPLPYLYCVLRLKCLTHCPFLIYSVYFVVRVSCGSPCSQGYLWTPEWSRRALTSQALADAMPGSPMLSYFHHTVEILFLSLSVWSHDVGCACVHVQAVSFSSDMDICSHYLSHPFFWLRVFFVAQVFLLSEIPLSIFVDVCLCFWSPNRRTTVKPKS